MINQKAIIGISKLIIESEDGEKFYCQQGEKKIDSTNIFMD